MRIVFVCLGNICRSPMAEAVFRQLATQAGIMDRIQIDSAATSSWNEGQPVHIGTKTILDTYGYVSDGLISRPLTKADGTADFLIGMANRGAHGREVTRLARRACSAGGSSEVIIAPASMPPSAPHRWLCQLTPSTPGSTPQIRPP